LVIGLGNPGFQYKGTRHNAGFWVIDLLLKRYNISLRKCCFRKWEFSKLSSSDNNIFLIKPLTYMNHSGRVIKWVKHKSHIKSPKLIIVCDSLDLPPGKCRIKRKGSSGGHKGLDSIIHYLGSNDFIRVHIGIGRPKNNESVIEHVLGVPDSAERDLYLETVEKAADAIQNLFSNPVEAVMNEFNR
jgi:peptidyl-tRNA hydrolase, PTH1 family